MERNVLKAFTIFRENGIEPILIKGLAAAANYPLAVSRTSVDLDLAVSAKDFRKASECLRLPEMDGLAVDLHRELRHLDTLAWSDLFDNSQLVTVDGGSYRVLRSEDHLRVLSVHWLNDGGVSKDRLWDIRYLIENRPADFDWDRALNMVAPTRRRWLVCTIGLAKKYIGVDLQNTPIEKEVEELPEWLINAVENEWATGQKLIPIWLILKEPNELIRQIKMRLNPNPIQATVEMEGSFDARTRVFYKIGNFFQRLFPSLRRNLDTLGRH